jgi:hypothetical protein
MSINFSSTRRRRLIRTFRAIAALILACVAGLFLAACAPRKTPSTPPNPNPTPPVEPGNTHTNEASKQPVIDCDEHRKGMPVRDNLLE